MKAKMKRIQGKIRQKMSDRVIHGIYNDDALLLNGVKELRSAGIEITEIYCPYPVHGLDTAVGLKHTRLAICAFIYAMIGVGLGATMMGFMNVVDWPMNIGGKPSFSFIENMTSFMPILFECGVFCAAHGMVLTFLLRSWVLPGVSNTNPDPRTTDDMFLVLLQLDDQGAKSAESILKKSGAVEINDV